jgi:predicted P-loop ATPase
MGAEKIKISIFNSVKETQSNEQLTIENFLDDVREGKWQDIVLKIRAERNKEKQTILKKDVPNVTLSGVFNIRHDDGLIVHSGFIGVDIDDLDDPEAIKDQLKKDPYIYAAFTSIGGRGLCVLIPINGRQHRTVFAGIQHYIFDRYNLVVDPTSVNVSRVRYVSYDPHLYINTKAHEFNYESAEKPLDAENRTPKYVFTKTDFEFVLDQINDQRLDITGGYKNWLKLGFAISDQFFENGRDYFHTISQYHADYSKAATDRQYNACLKAGRSGVTISTFFYIAKQHGLIITTERTIKIATIANSMRDEKLTSAQAIAYLISQGEKNDDELKSIVDQVFQGAEFEDNGETKKKNLALVAEHFLKRNYVIKYNEVTRRMTVNGIEMTDRVENEMYVTMYKKHPRISQALFRAVLYSDSVSERFNPFTNWFHDHVQDYTYDRVKGSINRLIDSIETNTGHPDFPEFKYVFITKWLVGIAAAMHGEIVPTMLVLSGLRQGTGKTEWFRRLLPPELKEYYVESKLDHGKDDDILMTQRLIIMDDEMGGKSKIEAKKLKEMTSRDTFAVRAPYGRATEILKRLAVLCGTTNDEDILMDITGNRRLIPVNVISINHDVYNSVTPAMWLMEAYWLYRSGFNYQVLRDDIRVLNEHTEQFVSISQERELILKLFRMPTGREVEDDRVDRFTSTDIALKIDRYAQLKVSPNKIGRELRSIGFQRKAIKNEGVTCWYWTVVQKISEYRSDGMISQKLAQEFERRFDNTKPKIPRRIDDGSQNNDELQGNVFDH